MPANRPPLARVHTPRTDSDRKAHLSQGITLTLDGESYTVRLGDLDATHARQLRQTTGKSFLALMRELQDDIDLDSIASLIWLARRLRGEDIDYADQLAEIRYDTDVAVKDADPVVVVPDDPEA